ncbi:MAG: hypothetical protein HY331_07085 [Chloroflexi bacterium]|nr:hypothetical protein [Chloroflexota bacterium]
MGQAQLGDAGITAELIEDVHRSASFAIDPSEARWRYRALAAFSAFLLERTDPVSAGLFRARVLMYAHDAECVLNRADLALAHAREAEELLLRGDYPRKLLGRQQWLLVNAYRAETVALNNLGLARRAYEVSLKTEEYLKREYRSGLGFWEVHVLGDQLSSFRRLPDPTVASALSVHERARRTATGVMEALVDHRLADCLIHHGGRRSLHDAEDWVRLGQERVADVHNGLGPLHRVLLQRTEVRLRSKIEPGSAHTSRRATEVVREAERAGLTHQVTEMKREFSGLLAEDSRSADQRMGR